MNIQRRHLAQLVALSAAGACPLWTQAQDTWPSRPVQLIVPVAAGGTADIIARFLAQHLSESWAQPVVVINRVGASGAIGARSVMTATPDGYTILLMNSGTNGGLEVLSPSTTTYKSDVDFAPIGMVGVLPSLLVVNEAVPVKTPAEFVALARAQPGKLTYGSATVGSASRLAFELLQSKYKLEFLHVPFNGTGPAIQAVTSNVVNAYIGQTTALAPLIQAGRVRPIAVFSPVRSAALPDVPTMAEAGFPGAEWDSWIALAAPNKVPDGILARMNRDVRQVLSTPAHREALAKLGLEARPGSRADLTTAIQNEIERTSQAVRVAKIPVN